MGSMIDAGLVLLWVLAFACNVWAWHDWTEREIDQ